MFKQAFKEVLVLAVIVVLIFYNIAFWHSAILGYLLLICYLVGTGKGASVVLSKFFNFSHRAWRVKILGMFFSLSVLGLISSLALNTVGFSAFIISSVFFISGLIFVTFQIWAGGAKNNPAEMDNPGWEVIEEVPQAKVGTLAFIILAAFGFYLLYSARAGMAISSPWQIVDPIYLTVFAAATLILGFLIFSNIKAKTILFLLFVLSLLLHSYLPLTHKLLYGADGWRHLAVESQLAQTDSLQVVSYAQGSQSLVQFLNPGKYSYGALWGTTVILSRLLNLDLLWLNAWLAPILWSILLPILLFELGMSLNWGKKESLFFAWLGMLPFAWQAGGSFSLPSSLGFLWGLFLILLLVKSLKETRKEQKIILVIAGALSFFGYALYFILFWLAWLVLQTSKIKHKLKMTAGFVATVLFIPLLEIISGYSHFDRGVNFLTQIKQFIGNFTAYYLASGPRPHDIAVGNIIFNQTPAYAFVPNFLTSWPWWLFIFMLVFWALAVVGIWFSLKRGEHEHRWLAILSIGLTASYFISRYLLAGEQILSRRLEPVLALLFLTLVFVALKQIIFKNEFQLKYYKSIYGVILAVFIFSVAITAGYSLGPDTYAVSESEYAAMNYVWQKEQTAVKPCVLADTYPLLALEAISAKKIVGGGWPINEYFAQPEKDKYFMALNKNFSLDLWNETLAVAKADHCWFITDVSLLTKNDFIYETMPLDAKIFGKTIVWRGSANFKN